MRLPRQPGQGRGAERAALAIFGIGQWEAGEGRTWRGVRGRGSFLPCPFLRGSALRRRLRRRRCARPSMGPGPIKAARRGARSTPQRTLRGPCSAPAQYGPLPAPCPAAPLPAGRALPRLRALAPLSAAALPRSSQPRPRQHV